MNKDLISRQQAIKEVKELFSMGDCYCDECAIVGMLNLMPPAQPFHNITMTDVLKYIDDMPEDVWQEFTACLECRGWYLQRETAKWCGSDFA